MFTPIENAFDAIDQHVKEISDRLLLSDDQLHQLFVMLSEHYGQLADKYNTAPDDGTDLRNVPDHDRMANAGEVKVDVGQEVYTTVIIKEKLNAGFNVITRGGSVVTLAYRDIVPFPAPEPAKVTDKVRLLMAVTDAVLEALPPKQPVTDMLIRRLRSIVHFHTGGHLLCPKTGARPVVVTDEMVDYYNSPESDLWWEPAQPVSGADLRNAPDPVTPEPCARRTIAKDGSFRFNGLRYVFPGPIESGSIVDIYYPSEGRDLLGSIRDDTRTFPLKPCETFTVEKE